MTGTASTPKSDVAQAIASVYRSERGRIVATLIRLVGDFDLAEEAAQEAFATAVNQWEASGIPNLPRAWIIRTARYKAIDHIRRRTRRTEKLEWYAASGLIPSSEEPSYDNPRYCPSVCYQNLQPVSSINLCRDEWVRHVILLAMLLML